ncbi:DUF2255 family protein [Cellulomonas endophytica]|uniref:DUF2255 family protein n=1 Tax=Cellulomonas endophytica TaxID=2494735 RepID=UPI001012E212|nr:DUF2255 family protein [Cellulomonas endophytica]
MTDWTSEQLRAVDVTDEVQVTPTGPDGAQTPAVTIWAVRVADAVYVRSARGPRNGWFVRARTSGTGRFSVGSLEAAVTFESVDPQDGALQNRLDAAYHAKYDRYGPRIVGSVTGPLAAQATLRVTPVD